MINTNDIQQNSINIFHKNLEYFKNSYQDIYQNVIDFKFLLDNQQLPERYSLEYVSGSYDLLNIKTNQYFYNKKLNKFNKKIEDETNFSSIKNTIHTIPFEIYDKDYLKKNEIKKDTKKAITVISKIISELRLKKEQNFKKIHKFIFLGSILGTHLQTVHKKINSKHYLIIEPDIEIFYLSLFVTRYDQFAPNSKKTYSIMDSKEILLEKLNRFYSNDFNKNYSIKYCLATSSYSYLFDTISISLGRLEGMSFSYISYVNLLKKITNQMKDGKYILNIKSGMKIFDNKPVLIVSPGPSLQKNMKWLKKYSNRFVIVSFSQTLKKLLSENIIPDIITIVDSDKKLYKDFKDIDKNILNKTILFANGNVNKNITKLFTNNNIFIYEKEFLLKPMLSQYILGATVGETTYQILLMLNAKEIYLLGTDLAVDSKSGKTHDEMHSYSSRNKLELDNLISYEKVQTINQDTDILKVEGNFQKEVYTTVFYNRLISYYNRITAKYRCNEQYVFNLSDGAKLNGIVPYDDIKKFEKLEIIQKDILHKRIIQNLVGVSSNEFLGNEKLLLKKEIDLVDNIIFKLKHISLDKNTYKIFDHQIIQIIKLVLFIREDNYFSEVRKKIFFNFFNININFLDYILNTSKKYDYERIIQKFNKQLIKVLVVYKKILIKAIK